MIITVIHIYYKKFENKRMKKSISTRKKVAINILLYLICLLLSAHFKNLIHGRKKKYVFIESVRCSGVGCNEMYAEEIGEKQIM